MRPSVCSLMGVRTDVFLALPRLSSSFLSTSVPYRSVPLFAIAFSAAFLSLLISSGTRNLPISSAKSPTSGSLATEVSQPTSRIRFQQSLSLVSMSVTSVLLLTYLAGRERIPRRLRMRNTTFSCRRVAKAVSSYFSFPNTVWNEKDAFS